VATRTWKPALGLVGGFAIACLAASPHTPRLVAFRQSEAATNAIDMSAQVGRSFHVPSAAVVPAAVRSESSSRATNKAVSAPTVVKRRVAPVRAAQERWSMEASRAHVAEVSAREEQYAPPGSQMLIFVQTTESVGPNAWVWRIQVWRVTMINPAPDQAVRGVVWHST
jgi:hypothetical protein